MKHADQVLDDAELLDAVYEAQGQRRPNSRRRGRKQTSSEATLRLAVPAVLPLAEWLPVRPDAT
jgi:hypothetical protein